MNFIVVGTNHKHSPIETREKIFFSRKQVQDVLGFLRETGALEGAVILSTCNRTEIYALAEFAGSGTDEIMDFLSRFCEINRKRLYPYLYIYKNKDAIRHLFRVSSGLDSLILGESQILGQVEAAFSESEKSGFTGYPLRTIFDYAVSAAKRIHAETRLSKDEISIGSAAIDFIRERAGTFAGKNILIVGVGKVTELVLKYIKSEKSNVIFVSNRTFEKARSLAGQIGAEAVRFDSLKECLKKADIVITATRSPHFVITKETLDEAFSLQPSAFSRKRLLIVDLALPRDVDPQVKAVDGVELFDLEDVGQAAQRSIGTKKLEAGKAEGIIEIEAEKLWERLLGLEQEKALLR